MRAVAAVAAFLVAVPVMAQFDPTCWGNCIGLAENCCNHDNNACDVLSKCGANKHTDACSQPGPDCLDYCQNWSIIPCINANA